jgi:hypothetical protein
LELEFSKETSVVNQLVLEFKMNGSWNPVVSYLFGCQRHWRNEGFHFVWQFNSTVLELDEEGTCLLMERGDGVSRNS